MLFVLYFSSFQVIKLRIAFSSNGDFKDFVEVFIVVLIPCAYGFLVLCYVIVSVYVWVCIALVDSLDSVSRRVGRGSLKDT